MCFFMAVDESTNKLVCRSSDAREVVRCAERHAALTRHSVVIFDNLVTFRYHIARFTR